MLRTLICFLIAVFLVACVNTGVPQPPPLIRGDIVRINQSFPDIVNGGHIDFQQGQIIAEGNLDRWVTWCRLYVYDPTRDADYRTTVEPDDFRVSTAGRGYQSSDFPNWSIHGIGLLGGGVHDMPAYYLYWVKMPLSSPQQPQLRSLECYRKWATPRANKYPNLIEIREAVGAYLDLIPVDNPDL